jgi:DNA-binding MarR family transcriptional regulator
MAKTKSELSPNQLATLKAYYDGLKPFRTLRETMPLQCVTAFLLVATDEHQSITVYATRAGTSQSLMSRHLADLGTVNRHHEEGFGLVEHYEDIMDRRNKLVRLTAKGKRAVEEMCEAFK